MPARPIPANRWFDVDVHLKLSPTDGQALTVFYLDGRKVAESTKRNMLNSSPLTFYNGGLSYSLEGMDTTVYFDRPRVGSVAPKSAPATAPKPTRAPADWTRQATFESSLSDGSDGGWNVPSPFSVERTSERGGAGDRYAAKIVTNGGRSGCSCPRMTFDKLPNGKRGDEIWIGASYLIPDPSKLVWSRLFNLAHYVSGDTNWYLGLTTRGDPGMMHFAFAQYGAAETG